MKDCNHCGRCCLSGIPCGVGQILFDITDENPTECPACVTEDGLLWCGLMKDPVKWLGSMLDDVGWKCEAMAEIFAVYIGIGAGCGVSPSIEQIARQMKEFYDSTRRPNGPTLNVSASNPELLKDKRLIAACIADIKQCNRDRAK